MFQHPFQQSSGMICLYHKKDNLYGGNVASGSLGIFVVDFALYGISFDPLRFIVIVQRFVRESNFFFRIIVSRICTLQSEKAVCIEYKNESAKFRKERMTRNSVWLPVCVVSSYVNYSFCSCNPLGQSFVHFFS